MSRFPGKMLAVGAILMVLLAGGYSAQAAEPSQAKADMELQASVDRELGVHPGGIQTAPDEISYDGGQFVVTVARPGQQAALACPAGWYCFWDGYNFTGNRGKLSACGTQALAQWNWQNRIKSVYNRTGDYVTFWDYATDVYQDFPGADDFNNVLHPGVYDAARRNC